MIVDPWIHSTEQTDGYYDSRIEPHDIVFLSEVLIHSLVPFHSIITLVNLAKEYLIIDERFPRQSVAPDFSIRKSNQSGKIMFTNFLIRELVFLKYLYILGIDPGCATRYHDPGGERTLWVINTCGATVKRSARIHHPSMQSMLNGISDN